MSRALALVEHVRLLHVHVMVDTQYLLVTLVLLLPEREHVSKHLATTLREDGAHEFTSLSKNTQTHGQPLYIIFSDWLKWASC